MKTILVPLDGSALADRAVPFATTIATRAGWSLLLLRAVTALSAPTDAAGAALKREAQEELDARAAALAADGLTVTTRVVDGPAETAILEAAAEVEVGLIAMSTHGRGGLGRFIYGSVADAVFRHAPVPVLVVPPHGADTWPMDEQVKILVPIDGSELSTTALGPACDLADLLGGSLILASVVPFQRYAGYPEGYAFVDSDPIDNLLAGSRQYLEGLAAEVRTDARPVEVCATFGSPYFGIMTIARDVGAGAIVMATHGRGGVARTLLGSVATATLRQSDVPVVLVRPAEVEQPPEAGTAPSPSSAERQGAAGKPEPVEHPVALTLSADQLDLLTSVVGERFYGQAVDPGQAEPVRLLLERLRAARAGSTAPAPPTP